MKVAQKLTINRQSLYAVLALVFGLLMIALPALASAEQLTERSIQLSSSSVNTANVSYNVKFTVDGDAEAFTVDFCAETPLIGEDCTTPAGFLATGVGATPEGATAASSPANNRVVVTKQIVAATEDEVEVTLTGIQNPSSDGTFFARIVTYETVGQAGSSTVGAASAGAVDQGSVAISITPTIGVSGTVLETLTFCVSGSPIDPNCTNTTAPVVVLGEETAEDSGIFALTPGVLSDGSIHTQLTTNASGGVVIRLKSNATACGGLVRAGTNGTEWDCIVPAIGDNIGLDATNNSARFGVITADATDTPNVSATGQLLPVEGSAYGNSIYAFNYVLGDETGVTGEYGDPFLDTRGAPATGKNMQLTFGATASTNTPAGNYTADLSMIAVGKF